MGKKKNHRLTKAQEEKLVEWISEGLQSDEINARASKFKPAFQVSRQRVDYHRRRTGVKISEIKETGTTSALRRGFALKEKRVETLNRLAEKMADELLGDGRLWLNQVKSVGSGKAQTIVDYEEFNQGEMIQLRGVLDDIAKEVGDRRQKVDVKVDARESLAALLGVDPDDLPVSTDNA